MNREEAYNRIDAIIAKHEIDDEYVTITSALDYDALRFARKLLEQEHCEDEYIKVPKKALKYRTAGMVAYNVKWLKNNFDIERAVICGAQEPFEDADVKLIHTQGLDEGIRCAMCTNLMANDRGCDGACVVNEIMYKKVLDVIRKQIIDKGEL